MRKKVKTNGIINFQIDYIDFFLLFLLLKVDAENVQRELEMLSQSTSSNDSKPNSLAQARGTNSDLHSSGHAQSNGVHSAAGKSIVNGLPSK